MTMSVLLLLKSIYKKARHNNNLGFDAKENKEKMLSDFDTENVSI